MGRKSLLPHVYMRVCVCVRVPCECECKLDVWMCYVYLSHRRMDMQIAMMTNRIAGKVAVMLDKGYAIALIARAGGGLAWQTGLAA